MKKFFFLAAALVALTANAAFANTSIAVVDFDDGKVCTKQEAGAMTDLFRNQLVQSGGADIVDRKHMEQVIAEYKFQMSDWANPAKIKQLGKRIGADYLMLGKFNTLANKPFLLVNMLDVETGKIHYSSRLNLEDWGEYDHEVKAYAKEFADKIPVGTGTGTGVLAGTWSTVITHNNIIDSYKFVLTDTNRCTVRVKSLSGDDEYVAEGQGTYSYDGTIFKITVVLKNSEIAHLKMIQWSAVTKIDKSGRSFNMLVQPDSGKDNTVRATFTKEK